MNSEIEKEMYKPQVSYEMCGDKVFLIIPQSDYNEHRLVMTKDLFIACYEHWIKKVEHDRQLSARLNGKWINSYDLHGNHYKRCSECGAYIEATFFANDYSVNFCPKCGAEMEVK